MQTLEITVNDKEINLINIYGPNNGDVNFLYMITFRKIFKRK